MYRMCPYVNKTVPQIYLKKETKIKSELTSTLSLLLLDPVHYLPAFYHLYYPLSEIQVFLLMF